MSACETLKTLIPANVYEEFSNLAIPYEIDTPLRVSHFLAQCSHESSGFQVTVENLNYSASALLKTFPKYFTIRTARQYARRPVEIGSRVYANRMGNGNEASKEGWKYKGRGYIQLTGKDNYRLFNEIVPEDILDEPVLVATKYPLLSAAWYWKLNGLNELADLSQDVTEITRKVNGGAIGLKDRQLRFNQYYTALKQFEE